jgi:hypothetical protein
MSLNLGESCGDSKTAMAVIGMSDGTTLLTEPADRARRRSSKMRHAKKGGSAQGFNRHAASTCATFEHS